MPQAHCARAGQVSRCSVSKHSSFFHIIFFSSLLYLEVEDILSCPCPEEQRQLTGFLSHQGLDL